MLTTAAIKQAEDRLEKTVLQPLTHTSPLWWAWLAFLVILTGSGIAAGMFLAGIGTDTGGSIRIPAAFCGVSGLMPTFGRVPKSGCTPLGYSLDHVGPLARSAWDCARPPPFAQPVRRAWRG